MAFNRHPRRHDFEEMGHKFSEKAKEKLGEWREGASELLEEGREHAKEWKASVEEYVEGHPLQSLFIAAGIGAVLGLLLTAMSRRGEPWFGERRA